MTRCSKLRVGNAPDEPEIDDQLKLHRAERLGWFPAARSSSELPIVSNEEGSATEKEPRALTSACRVVTIVATGRRLGPKHECTRTECAAAE
jgi:hypothetical protein